MSEPRTAAGRALVEDEPRLVTGEHSMLARVLAIEAEAAALDVGRLARALSAVKGWIDPYSGGFHVDDPRDFGIAAAAIAAAYSEAKDE